MKKYSFAISIITTLFLSSCYAVITEGHPTRRMGWHRHPREAIIIHTQNNLNHDDAVKSATLISGQDIKRTRSNGN